MKNELGMGDDANRREGGTWSICSHEKATVLTSPPKWMKKRKNRPIMSKVASKSAYFLKL